MSKIKVYSEVLLRIEVRNMKRERFNRLFGTGCVTFSLFCCLSKEFFVLPKKVFRVSRVTNENYTLFRNLPKRGNKTFKLLGYPRLKAMVKCSCARTKKEVNINDFCFRNSIIEFYFFFSHLLQRRRCNYVI